MEILSNKLLATAFEASLGCMTVTAYAKRRQQGNRDSYRAPKSYKTERRLCCSRSRSGRFRVKRKTSKKKFAKKCKEVHRLIGSMRTLKVKEIISKLNQIVPCEQ